MWLWIVLIVVAVVFLVLLFRIAHGLFRVAFSLAVLGLLICSTGFLLWDANNVRQHLYSDEKLFLLDIDGRVAGAFVLGTSRPEIISDASAIRNAYPDLAAVKGSAYKVIVVKWPAIAGNVELEGFSAAGEEIIAALRSGKPKGLLVENTVRQYGHGSRPQAVKEADRLYPTDDAFAGALFSVLAAKTMQEPALMLANIRSGVVVFYPETITFKILKFLPESIGRLLMPVKEASNGPV